MPPPDVMIVYLVDHQHGVLMARFEGALTDQSIIELDESLRQYVETHGMCRGILDLSHVTNASVTMSFLVQRAQANPLIAGQRVFVGLSDHVYGLLRLFQTYQGITTSQQPPIVVRTMEEAYSQIGLESSNFEPVDISPTYTDTFRP